MNTRRWWTRRTSLKNKLIGAKQKSKDKLAFLQENIIYDNWNCVIFSWWWLLLSVKIVWDVNWLDSWFFFLTRAESHLFTDTSKTHLQLHLWHESILPKSFLLSRLLHLFNCAFNTFLIMILRNVSTGGFVRKLCQLSFWRNFLKYFQHFYDHQRFH